MRVPGVALFATVLMTSQPAVAYRVTAWAVPSDTAALESIQRHAGLLDEVNPVWFKVREDGTLIANERIDDPAWRAAMTGPLLIPSIQNGTTKATVMQMQSILASPELRSRHINAIVEAVRKHSFDGIEIDYEWMMASARDDFSAFIEELAARLHADGKRLSVTLHPTPHDTMRDGPGSQDWLRIGRAADSVKIMAYDYSWASGPPGPIAPLDWLEGVARYAVRTLPARKTFMALPWYGYDWKEGSTADAVFYAGAREIALREGVEVGRDPNGEPNFKFRAHTVYYQDKISYMQKVDVLRKYAFAGFSHWRPGGEDPEKWTVIRDLRKMPEKPEKPRAIRSGAFFDGTSHIAGIAVVFGLLAAVLRVR